MIHAVKKDHAATNPNPEAPALVAVDAGDYYGAACEPHGTILKEAKDKGLVFFAGNNQGGVFFTMAAVMTELDKVRAKRR